MSQLFKKIRSNFPVTTRILENYNTDSSSRFEPDGFSVLTYIQHNGIAIYVRTQSGLKKII